MFAGWWLSRIYALPSCVSQPDSFVAPILAGLFDILLAAGCVASRSDVISGLSSTYEARISPTILLAGRLNQMLNARAISGELEVFVVRPGERFHEETIEDLDGSGDTRNAK